jgi:hypothetical protein
VDPSFRRPALWVFAILLGSYAFYWHSRDWNTASRLMLTYSLVDRGTVEINGLERQTRDVAWFRGLYYCDKLPGYSLLATIPYTVARSIFRLPPHPLNRQAFSYWAADYWVTLGTSGLCTAGTAALLVLWAGALGCSRRSAALVGLAYGLATPAYVYATLAYGHQVSAFALFAAFYLLARNGAAAAPLRMFIAGFLAAYAAVVELQVGPVAAILGFYLLVQCFFGRVRKSATAEPSASSPGVCDVEVALHSTKDRDVVQRKPAEQSLPRRRLDALAYFAFGVLPPTLILLFYNQVAFGTPWDMGYFHHATREFAQIHNPRNPLGLGPPDWSKLVPLLWGRYRGLLFYAPILLLSLPGWVALVARRKWELAAVSSLVVAAVILVNLSYPEWTGGWTTGPRLLVPLLPFAMLPVAASLGGCSASARLAAGSAFGLFLAGGALLILFQGADARIPHTYEDPLVQAVWPIWNGYDPLPAWRNGDRFCRNALAVVAGPAISNLPPMWQWLQFVPLVLVQTVAIGVAAWYLRPRSESESSS